MTTRRLVLFVLVAVSALVATAPYAGACSCALEDDEIRYREADAAVIGTVISDDGERGRIRVEHDFKVDLGTEVVVPTEGNGGTCGLDLEPGERVSLLLDRAEDGSWNTGTCYTIDPDSLPGAKDRLPPAAGEGTASLLLFGSSSGGRMAALDDTGRLLAYGRGSGDTYAVSVCPGSRHAVELVGKGRHGYFAVRRLRDMRVVRERRLPWRKATVLSCRDRDAHAIVAATFARKRGELRELRAGRWRTLRRAGPMVDAELQGGFAFIDAGKGRGTRAFDLATRGERRLPRLPGTTSDWAISPDGTHAAAITAGSYRDVARRSGLVVVRLRGGPLRVVTRALPDLPWLDASVVWRGGDRLLLGGDSNRLRLFDRDLRPVFTYASRPEPIKLHPSGDRLYGLGGDGLHVVEGPQLRERVLGEPPAYGLYNLAVVPGGTEIRAGR